MHPARFLALMIGFSAGLLVAVRAADDTGRFTRTISSAERAESGIDRLSSDETAVLDALIRRDAAARVTATTRPPSVAKSGSKPDAKSRSEADAKAKWEPDAKAKSEPDAKAKPDTDAKAWTAESKSTAAPSSFSQRLTADERRLAGFDKLTPEQAVRLDTLIERHASASVARALLAPPTYLSRRPQIEPTERDDRRKIHGSFSLSYGWGKGGYSERTGAMQMTYDDPAGRYSVTIGYAESHVKGGPGYGVYLDDPFYREP